MRRQNDPQYDLPVVMAKQSPHKRELESIQVPGEEGYYRAYEDDKEFLIPKENLEAMKELVNYKLRRRADSKFNRIPDAEQEKKALKRFHEKLEHLAFKMEEYEEFELKPLEKEMEQKRSPVFEEVEKKFKMSEVSVGEIKHSALDVVSLNLDNLGEPKEESLRSKRSTSEEIRLHRSTDPDTTSVKFLVSGHFRKNKKPIFIIRQYRGSSVIEGKNSDFNSSKIGKYVDISMSGMFYRNTILDERNDRPATMRFKSRKKILIDNRSTILEDGFINLFPAREFDVVVGGMFVKRPASPHYTPLVSIAVKRIRDSNYNVFNENRAMIMSMSAPVIKTPFVQDLRKTQSAPRDRFHRRRTVSPVTREPQGFKSLLTRIDEGEETFECPKSRSRSSSKSSNLSRNTSTKKSNETRATFTLPKMFSFDSFLSFKKEELGTRDNHKRTKSTTIASQNPVPTVTDLYVAKEENVSIPSTSQSKPHTNFEKIWDIPLIPAKPTVDENNKKSNSSKKPGFFKRIFKKLFFR